MAAAVNRRLRLLFLQLPRLDNDVGGATENVMLAAAYLTAALERCEEGGAWETRTLGNVQESGDNAHVLKALLAAKPDVVVVTLYVWNVERSLRVLRALKRRLPGVRIAGGGPEVARRHPFVFRSTVLDAAAVGEGEPVFAEMLAALRCGETFDSERVGWRRGRRFVWGGRAVAETALAGLLPDADAEMNRPDANGMAYLETARGCPMRCSFCCYNQRRRGVSVLGAAEVARRVTVLRERGAREIRFIDPTFNAVPTFRDVLRGVAAANADGGLRCFLELRADTLTPGDVALLVAAGVVEAEVGVQSTNPAVLRRIHRPTKLVELERGIRLLLDAGIVPTVDMMCGLPGQSREDMLRSLRWMQGLEGAYTQFLHTLLLPGTELRDQRHALGLVAQARPPYRVLETPLLSEETIGELDGVAEETLGGAGDCPTQRFVGKRLPGLFEERVDVDVSALRGEAIPGGQSRRTVMLHAECFAESLPALLRVVRGAVRCEPDVLWQFVLCIRREEPLDVFDALIGVLDGEPEGFLDRLLIRSDGERVRASRRVFVRLPGGRRIDAGWCDAVEALLGRAFY